MTHMFGYTYSLVPSLSACCFTRFPSLEYLQIGLELLTQFLCLCLGTDTSHSRYVYTYALLSRGPKYSYHRVTSASASPNIEVWLTLKSCILASSPVPPI